jgi:hypothetical protein
MDLRKMIPHICMSGLLIFAEEKLVIADGAIFLSDNFASIVLSGVSSIIRGFGGKIPIL